MNSSNKLHDNQDISRLSNKTPLVSSLASNLRATVALAALAASNFVGVGTSKAQESSVQCQQEQICDTVKGASESVVLSLGHQSTDNPFDANALSGALRLILPSEDRDNMDPSVGADFLIRTEIIKGLSLEFNSNYTLLNAEYGPNENQGRGHLALRYQTDNFFAGAGGGFMELVSPIKGAFLGHAQAGYKTEDTTITLGVDVFKINNDNEISGFVRLAQRLNENVGIYVEGSKVYITNAQDNLDSQFSAMAGLQFTFSGGQINTGIGYAHPVYSQVRAQSGSGFNYQFGFMHMAPSRVSGNSYTIETYTNANQVKAYLDSQTTLQIISVDFSKLSMLKSVLYTTDSTQTQPTTYRYKVSSLTVSFSNISDLGPDAIETELDALAYLTNQGRLQATPSDSATVPNGIRAQIQSDQRFRGLRRGFLENIQLTGTAAHFAEIMNNENIDDRYPRLITQDGYERIYYNTESFIEAEHAHFIDGNLYEVKQLGEDHTVRFIKSFNQNINIQAMVLESHSDHNHDGTITLINKLKDILSAHPELTAHLHHHNQRIEFVNYRGHLTRQNLLADGVHFEYRSGRRNSFSLTAVESMGIGRSKRAKAIFRQSR